MSVYKAKEAAQAAVSYSDTNQKLTALATAILELAKSIGDIEDDVARIKNKTGS